MCKVINSVFALFFSIVETQYNWHCTMFLVLMVLWVSATVVLEQLRLFLVFVVMVLPCRD